MSNKFNWGIIIFGLDERLPERFGLVSVDQETHEWLSRRVGPKGDMFTADQFDVEDNPGNYPAGVVDLLINWKLDYHNVNRAPKTLTVHGTAKIVMEV